MSRLFLLVVTVLAACTRQQSVGSADTSKAIRAAAAAPRTSVRGEAFLEGDEPLPAGAVVRVELRDTTRPRDPAGVLGTQEFSADQGPPWAFDLLAPDSLVGARAGLVVSARIDAGDRLLFATGEDTPVEAGQANGPVQLRLNPVTQTGASGAVVGRQPVTPVPTLTVNCGGEVFRLAFETGAAYVTEAGKPTLTLSRLTRAAGEDETAPRQFTNGRLTFIQAVEGTPRIRFARGKRAFVDCAEVR